jgi:SAM-dependent methyltransferase
MVETPIPTTGSAERQARLWSRAAGDWSEHTEVLMSALFSEVLAQLGVGPGTRLLDVGCGSGVAAAIASGLGAAVSGLDATPELLDYARKRAPDADFRQGEMEWLPYPDGSFDIVTGFNSFQYAASPVNALAEARRVCRPGGLVMIATWGRPERVDMAPVMRAVAGLLTPPPPGAPGPFALSEDGALAALVRKAGLQPRHGGTFVDGWTFADLETALRAILSAGVMTPAFEIAGEDAVRAAVSGALEAFRADDGGYRLKNEFVYLIARA